MVLRLWWQRTGNFYSRITRNIQSSFIYSYSKESFFNPIRYTFLSVHAQNVYSKASLLLSLREEDAVAGNLVELKAFVEFLRDKLGFAFDKDSFDHRIMLQKYVFIVQLLGWTGKPYYYNIYMHGPYSPALSDDYYKLSPRYIGKEWYKTHLPDFDQTRFLQVVQGKDVNWLEVGATLLSLYNSNKTRMNYEELVTFVFERVKEIKNNFSEEFILDVFCSLAQNGLLIHNN